MLDFQHNPAPSPAKPSLKDVAQFRAALERAKRLAERPAIAVLVLIGAFGVLSGLFALGNRTNMPLVYQGRLTDASYLPITDSARNIRFKIWDASTAGNCVWSTGSGAGSANCGSADSAAVVSVNISNGNFTVPLGSNATNNPEILLNFSSGPFYLEVIADNENPLGTYETLSPRKQVSGSAYAYVANNLMDGTAHAKGKTAGILTGSIDPTASTSVVGVGTKFLSELSIGDSITVNAEGRRVATIVDDLNLTVTSAFTDTANDTSVDVAYAIMTARDTSDSPGLIVSSAGTLEAKNFVVYNPSTASAAVITLSGERTTIGGSANRIDFQAPGSLNLGARRFQINNIGGFGSTGHTFEFTALNEAGTSQGMMYLQHGGTTPSGANVPGGVAIGSYAHVNRYPPSEGLIVSGRIGAGVNTPAQALDVGGNVMIATRGSEKQANGVFGTSCSSWTLGTGWTCDTTNEEVDHTAGNTATLEQDVSAVAGETYAVSFIIRNASAGSITPAIGGISGTAASTNILQTQTIVATGTGNLTFTPTSNFDGSIDTVRITKMSGGNLYAMGSVGIGATTTNITGSGSLPALTMYGVPANSPTLEFVGNNVPLGANPHGRLLFLSDVAGTKHLTGEIGVFNDLATDAGYMSFYTKPTGSAFAERMRITSAGKMGIRTVTPLTTLDVAGNFRTTGKASAVLTGSIDPAASTTVTGSGTAFTTELVVGDRITVSGETRTVTAIASATSLTVDTAFTDNANDTSPDVLYAIATMRDSSGALKAVINDQGKIGVGTTAPDAEVTVTDGNSYTKLYSIGGVLTKKVGAGSNAEVQVLLDGVDPDRYGTIRFMRNDIQSWKIHDHRSLNGSLTFQGGGQDVLLLQQNGNVGILPTGATPAALTRLDLFGNFRTTGKASAVLTGSIDPAASTTVTGSGTAFTTELVVGDRITVSGETRTVTAIASATSLTVDTAFTDNANDTSPDVLYAIATMRDSSNAVKLAINNLGNVNIYNAAYTASYTASSGQRAAFTSQNDQNNYVQMEISGSAEAGTLFGLSNSNLAYIRTAQAGAGAPTLAIGTGSSAPLVFGTANTERARFDASGNLGVNTTSPTITGTGKLHVSGNTVRPFDVARTPATSSETCNAGEITFDSDYIYVCTAANTWKRSAIATW